MSALDAAALDSKGKADLAFAEEAVSTRMALEKQRRKAGKARHERAAELENMREMLLVQEDHWLATLNVDKDKRDSHTRRASSIQSSPTSAKKTTIAANHESHTPMPSRPNLELASGNCES